MMTAMTRALVLALILASCVEPAPERWEGINRSESSCDSGRTQRVCVWRSKAHLCLREPGEPLWRCAPSSGSSVELRVEQ